MYNGVRMNLFVFAYFLRYVFICLSYKVFMSHVLAPVLPICQECFECFYMYIVNVCHLFLCHDYM